MRATVRLIGESRRKDDRLDARTLARLARIDPQLLCPVKHRSAKAQAHLTVIRARAGVVRARTALINSIRGLTKSYGDRLHGCSPLNLDCEKVKSLSPEVQAALTPLLQGVESLGERIRDYVQNIESIAQEHYPETALLKQVRGVGTLVALTYLLTLEDPHRFSKSRDAGCYAGLQPGTAKLRTKRTTTAHQQRRRRVFASVVGAKRAPHSGTGWEHVRKNWPQPCD